MTLHTSTYHPPESGRGKELWVTLHWPLGFIAVVLIGVIALLLSTSPAVPARYGLNNPAPEGAQALARILTSEGVSVHEVNSLASAHARLAKGPATLVIVNDRWLSVDEVVALTDAATESVITRPSRQSLSHFFPTLTPDFRTGTDPTQLSAFTCTAPVASAAKTIVVGPARFISHAPDAATDFCFTTSSQADDASTTSTAGFMAFHRDQRVTAVASIDPFLNARLASRDNAAFALWLTGGQETLVWFNPQGSPANANGNENNDDTAVLEILPQWVAPFALLAVFTGGFLMLWRGRRLGRVVGEPLPVVTLTNETLYGRGRLYRRSGDTEHATTSLRLGFLQRVSAATGITASSNADEVVTAIAAACEVDPLTIRELLYGPHRTTNAQLREFAELLTTLEKKVHGT